MEAMGKDETALVATATGIEEALSSAFASLNCALQAFFKERAALIQDEKAVVELTMKGFSDSIRVDRAALASLKSRYSSQTLSNGIFTHCNSELVSSSSSPSASTITLSQAQAQERRRSLPVPVPVPASR